MAVSELAGLIRAEYLEMPGLRLTTAQAARLWRLDQEAALRALESLVRAGVLARDRTGAYVLPSAR